jgi:hypothetical protein
LPSAGNGCTLFVYEEVLPDGRKLLRVPRLSLLHVYLRVLWHGEAGRVETETSPGVDEPTAREKLAGGFFVLGMRSKWWEEERAFDCNPREGGGKRNYGRLKRTKIRRQEK